MRCAAAHWKRCGRNDSENDSPQRFQWAAAQRIGSFFPAGTMTHPPYACIPGTQPQEHNCRIPPKEPYIRQDHVHIQGDCIPQPG